MSEFDGDPEKCIDRLTKHGHGRSRRVVLETLDEIAQSLSVELFEMKRNNGWIDVDLFGPLPQRLAEVQEIIRELCVSLKFCLAVNGFSIGAEIPLHHPVECQLLELRGCISELLDSSATLTA